MATVSYVLQQCVEKADIFELDALVVVFDQALYAKAQQIRWKNDLYQKATGREDGGVPHMYGFYGCYWQDVQAVRP